MLEGRKSVLSHHMMEKLACGGGVKYTALATSHSGTKNAVQGLTQNSSKLLCYWLMKEHS